ncbi:MAG: MMPL family transporter [Spirochaetales bacterium]|nr:MMPL family transporter [Spirochaetales bacterium]
MFEKYGNFLERKSRIIIGCLAAVIVAAVIGIVRVDIDTGFSLFAPVESPYSQAGNLMKEQFGDSQQLLVMVPLVDAGSGLRQAEVLSERVAGIDGVVRVLRLAQIYENDGETWTLIRVMLSADVDLRAAVDEVKSMTTSVFPGAVLSGEAYLETQMFDYILGILLFLPPAAIFLMLGIFRLRIGSFRATALSMVPATVGALITLGALSWIQGTISAMSVLVPVYVIVLGSADGLHVTSHVMDQLGEKRSNREAILLTLEAVGVPIILTSLTTMAGFLSLLIIGSPAIREMAVTAAAGMLVAGVVTWVVLPILLFRQRPLPPRVQKNSGGLIHALWQLRGWPSIALAIVVVGAAVPGVLRLTAEFSMVDMYKARTEVRTSIDTVSEVTGGAFPLTILANAPDLFDPEVGRAMLELQNRLHAEGLTTRELSVYSLVEAAAGRIPGNEGYPESQALIAFIAEQIVKASPELYPSLVSEAGWARLLLYVENLSTEYLYRIVEIIEDVSNKSGIELRPTGSAFEIMDLNRVIIPQQLRSMGLALLLVVILTAASLKNVKAGLKAVIPIVITLAGLYGVMGYAGIDLSVVTSIMSGLTIGVGIDYAIHYTSVFMYLKRKKNADPVFNAMSFVATPVLANAIGLSVGFSVMVFSPLQTHTTLSILMWVTMVLSALFSLSLLPTLLGARRKTY